jgi:hypothetical protein
VSEKAYFWRLNIVRYANTFVIGCRIVETRVCSFFKDMKYLSFLLVVVFSAYQAVGQGEKDPKWGLLSDKTGWSEGSILLTNNTEITGMVKYNDREGILSYYDGDNTRVFGPRSVMGFEFFDEEQKRQRVFYTLDWGEEGAKKPLIFEVLREFKTFAVLVKFDPVQAEFRSSGWVQPNYSTGTQGSYGGGRTVISQTETVYLMGTDGELQAYFRSTVEQNGMRSLFTGKDDRISNEVIDRDLLEKYIGTDLYAKLTAYAKENDLKFKTQEDLLKILDYHKDLLKR